MEKTEIKQEKESKNKDKKADVIGHRERLSARFITDKGLSMPDYELLELLLTFAIPRRDVKPEAKRLLKHFLNLANVLTSPIEELMQIEGIGKKSALLCGVVHACANKISWENLNNRDTPKLTDKKKIFEFCRTRIGYAPQEQVLIIYLDIHGEYMRESIEQVGTTGAVMLSPKEITKKALMYGASRIIVSHNHPSGNCTPSKADIEMTQKIKMALSSVDLILEDHIIISPREAYSMKDHLPFMNNH